MKRFITLALIFILAVLIIWPLVRGYLPSKVVSLPPGSYINSAVNVIIDPIAPFVPFINRARHAEKIRVISPEQFIRLVTDARRRHDRPTTLLYLYNLECNLCYSNLYEVNQLGELYSKDDLLIIAAAVDVSPDALVTHLDNLAYDGVSFVPLLLEGATQGFFIRNMEELGGRYKEIPYLAVIDRNDTVIDLAPGPGRLKRMQQTIDTSIRTR